MLTPPVNPIMGPAKSLRVALAAANGALLFFAISLPALPANLFFGIAPECPDYTLSAFHAANPADGFTPPLGVMVDAKMPAKVGEPANGAFAFGLMKFSMLSSILEEHQILNPVIVRDVIGMVNYFLSRQVPSDGFLHYQPMLSDISSAIMIWMVRQINEGVSFGMTYPSAFPIESMFDFGHAKIVVNATGVVNNNIDIQVS